MSESDRPTPPRTELVGQCVSGRYRLERSLAGGGMAQVYEATDEVLNRPVAVKLLHPHLAADEQFLARFRAEAVSAARLAHPSIVSIYDTCADLGTEAIVMELVRGRTLRDLLDRRHTLTPAEVVTVGAQVADALATAHRAGVVHRDIKPANILLADDGRVLVADFGIAKATEGSDLTNEGWMVGTAKYLAPEQVEGQPVDGRADVYALGVVLYESLCGRPPFQEATDAATALARLTKRPLRPRQIRAGIPRGLEQIILRCLAVAPDGRWPTAADLRAALLASPVDATDDDLDDADDLDPRDLLTGEHRALGPALTGAVGAATAGAASALAATAAGAPSAVPPVGGTGGVGGTPPPGPAPSLTSGPGGGGLGPGGLAADVVQPGDAEDAGPGFVRSERSWLVPTLIVVAVAIALGIAGTILGQTSPGRHLIDSVTGTAAKAAPKPLPVAAAHSFDPYGDNKTENEPLAARTIDGNGATVWQTERYASSLAALHKPGVGVALELRSPADLRRLVVTSPSAGWSAQVYVADRPATDLAGWGTPVDERTDIAAGTTTFDLKGRHGQAVLLWVTQLAPEESTHQVRIAELVPEG